MKSLKRSGIMELKKVREFRNNREASAVPLLLFLITIISVGALYTLFFLEIGYPTLRDLVPDSDSKTFILMLTYAIPLFVLFVGVIALIKEGLKKTIYYGGY